MITQKPSEILQYHPGWVSRFIQMYQCLSIDSMSLLDATYHQDITFIDPMHKVEGLDNLQDYFIGLYENLSHCDFAIINIISSDNEAALYWEMSFRHKSLNQGHTVTVLGNSFIKHKEGKIIYQQDYFDLGAMLYEQLPVVGKVIKWFKKRAAN